MIHYNQQKQEQGLSRQQRRSLEDALFKLAGLTDIMQDERAVVTSEARDLGGILKLLQSCPEQDLAYSLEIRESVLEAFEFETSENPELTVFRLIDGFEKLQGCDQGDKHKEGDAITHTALVFAETANILKNLARKGLVGRSECYVLLIASLVHDIEKPSTREEKSDPNSPTGRKVSFIKHEKKAAERCQDLGEKFGLTDEETATLQYIVENHTRAHQLRQESLDSRLKLLGQSGEDFRKFAFLLLFQAADARATWLSVDGSVRQQALLEDESFWEELNQTLSAYKSRIEGAELEKLKKQLRPKIIEILKKQNVPEGRSWGMVIDGVTRVIAAQGSEADTSTEAIEEITMRILETHS